MKLMQNKLNPSIAGSAAVCMAWAFSHCTAVAAGDAGAGTTYGMSGQGNPWHIGASVDYSYVGSGDVTFSGTKGSSDAQSVNANLTGEIPLSDQWFIPMGIDSHNLFLGTVAAAPIPDQINTLGMGAGVGYHINDQWTVTGIVGPRFYRIGDVEGDGDVGVGGVVHATYRWTPSLTVGFGLAFEPDSDVPVLPVAGLRWEIQTNLILNLMWPKPALIYRVNHDLDAYICGGGNFTVFRAGTDFGTRLGQPVYNNALATYRDFHVGAGVNYRLVRGLSLEIEGGYSVGREIDYNRLDQTVSFDPAPYVEAGIRYRF